MWTCVYPFSALQWEAFPDCFVTLVGVADLVLGGRGSRSTDLACWRKMSFVIT